MTTIAPLLFATSLLDFTDVSNYKISWIKKDSLVLHNENFTIQLRRIKKGVCLSEVEGLPGNYQPFIDSFYERRNAQ